MKRITRVLGGFLIVLCSIFNFGCNMQSTYFSVDYDYGRYEKGKATQLINSCLIFFDKEKFGLEDMVAGDTLIVKSQNGIFVLESYPGQVVVNGYYTVKYEKQAEIIEVSVTDGGVYFQGSLLSDGMVSEYKLPEYVITSKDGAFVPFSEMENGALLYASVVVDPVVLSETAEPYVYAPKIYAFYSYNPRPNQF